MSKGSIRDQGRKTLNEHAVCARVWSDKVLDKWSQMDPPCSAPASRILCTTAQISPSHSESLPAGNETFIVSFSGPFTGFALAMTPDRHPTNLSITPQWNTWPKGQVEGVFNTTEAGDANICASTTNAIYPGIVERCSVW
ncbi:hypothetical protein CONPUDRAFT_154735 [Coniophora puteana RWD-64-598 SS2]|uniref:Uncharacterized protein n=1 Tax=Coniophora puteana (strain RWD-64-598) TaxID=741705 RepID=A0A5M3MNK5_CONPW|nr:uncharacterized protein CONPUDRAFT_154735 [Coniophora puteana RWD-64-598 SS2]EIW80729.1 hypothetical protein CONPUDRAFT_154735 [Coniophora puteana RWD-64-598 SS2]